MVCHFHNAWNASSELEHDKSSVVGIIVQSSWHVNEAWLVPCAAQRMRCCQMRRSGKSMTAMAKMD